MFDYLKRIEQGEDYQIAFKSVFNLDFEQFDRELLGYISGRRMYARVFPHDAINPHLKIGNVGNAKSISQPEFFRRFISNIGNFSESRFGFAERKKLADQVKAKYGSIFNNKSGSL